MKFLIQKINGEIRHDFTFALLESIRFKNWLSRNDKKDKIKVKFKLFDKVFGLEGEENVNTKVEALKPSELIMISVNTGITVGMVKIVNAKEGTAEINLRIPIVPIKSENIGIARNINNHWRLIGYCELI